MINIRVVSRIGNDNTFLQADITQDVDFVLANVSSPISYVNDSFNYNVKYGFDYSFYDEIGYHEVVGYDNTPIRNLLILVARSRRKVIFDFGDKYLNLVNEKGYQYITEHDFDDKSLRCLGLWAFYHYYTLLQVEGKSCANIMLEQLRNVIPVSEVLLTLDSEIFNK